MIKETEHMSVEELQERMQRKPTVEEKGKMKNNLEVFESIFRKIVIEDGFAFLKNLRKEVSRQKTVKTVDGLKKQVLNIQNTSAIPCQVTECDLADSFEISEE